MKETIALLDEAIAALPKPEGYEDWEYRDIPWSTREEWNALMAMFGENNVSFLAMSTMRRDGVPKRRGQVFISPRGLANELAAQPQETP